MNEIKYKETTRDIVYKVRLNVEEDRMLTQASEWTGQAKSEVVRKALLGYYRAVEVNERMKNPALAEAGWPTESGIV